MRVLQVQEEVPQNPQGVSSFNNSKKTTPTNAAFDSKETKKSTKHKNNWCANKLIQKLLTSWAVLAEAVASNTMRNPVR